MYDEVLSRNTITIAIAQEDKDRDSHAKFFKNFGGSPRFELAYDVNREQTPRYERTSTYIVDRDGIVRQEFPSLIRHRPDWTSILGELDRIQAERGDG